MSKNLIRTLGMAALVLLLVAGCKKDKDVDEKTRVVSQVTGAAGDEMFTFDYGHTGKLLRTTSSNAVRNMFYNGDKIVKRQTASNNGDIETDSLFYDNANRLSRIVKYNVNGKVSVRTLTYTSDNTLSTAELDYVDANVTDKVFEYTYTGGRITRFKLKELISGILQIKADLELLTVDDKINPFEDLYKTYYPDEVDALFILWSGPHNVLTGRQTNYTNGNVTSVTQINVTYIYDSNNTPTSTTILLGSNGTLLNYTYTEL